MVNWLTAFIAVIVAGITFLQWITARQKVLLDLFDRRFSVYEELREVMLRHLTMRVNSTEDLEKFKRVVGRAQFLFGSKVTSFLEKRQVDFSDSVFERTHPREEWSQAAEDRSVARDKLLTSFFTDFDGLVAPYMKHTQKRVQIPFIDM